MAKCTDTGGTNQNSESKETGQAIEARRSGVSQDGNTMPSGDS